MQNLRCDKEGVPLLVQEIKYYMHIRIFKVLFFNGVRGSFTCELVGPKHLGFLCVCTRRQLLEAENNITRLARTEWKAWFPIEREAIVYG